MARWPGAWGYFTSGIGNLLVQMLAMGDIQSLEEGREIIRNSFAAEAYEFEPRDLELWKEGMKRWRNSIPTA